MAVDKDGDLGGRDDAVVAGTPVAAAWTAPRAQRVHPVLRTLGAGGATLVLLAGFMAASVADLPWNRLAQHPGFSAPVEQVPADAVEVVGASSATGPQSVAEVLQVVEDAEMAVLESGQQVDPEMQQAAAELGSLLAVYVAQQDAAVVPRVGTPADRPDVVQYRSGDAGAQDDAATGGADAAEVDVETDGLGMADLEPPARAEQDDRTGDDARSVDRKGGAGQGKDAAGQRLADPAATAPTDRRADDADGADHGAASDPSTRPAQDDASAAVPQLGLPTLDELLGGQTFPVGDALGAGPAADAAPAGSTAGSGAGADAAGGDTIPGAAPAAEEPATVASGVAVTFDDVVVAATRLVSLLNAASTTFVVDVRPAVTELPDGTFVTADGVRVTANGIPLDDLDGTLSAALASVVAEHAGSTAGYSNGNIPASVLCEIASAPGHLLRCDAAEQFAALNAAYRDRFGVDIPITDSYRSYAAQVAVRATKPHLAAVPGTSNHGWGLALDLSTPISGGASAEYAWLRVHGPDYGWDNPSWARPGGTKPEPWHFEFFAAGPIPDRATSTADVSGVGSVGTATGDDGGAGADGRDDGGAQDAGGAKDRGSKHQGGAKDKGGSKNTSGAKDQGGSKGGEQATGALPKPAPEPTPTVKPKPTPSASPSPSPEPSPSPSPEPSPSPSPEPSPSPSASPTPTPSPTTSPKPSPSPSPSPSAEPSSAAGSEDAEDLATEEDAATEDAEDLATEDLATEDAEGTAARTELERVVGTEPDEDE
ncbi:D-alanyl-D-alanine carboxypeptidase family protein [Isoptericola aurantiacus]|uniref:D-alanyl-D-alanine carboxypeptidase family protein n=1 Tax=Isoptericola aurantiacus TaxID=3377839 RepID=UPI00383B8491